MGSKYTSNSASGYNSTPPSDDGTQSEANKVKWSTIKTKLTDPVKTLADTINTDVNTALDYGPVSVVSSAVTLGSSHNNQFIELSGAATPTLNSADGLGSGWFCDVKNIGSQAITIARTKSGDTIDDVTADVTMNPLDYIRFVVNAAATGFYTVGIKKATTAQITAGTASDVFVTPESLVPPSVSGYVAGNRIYLANDGADGIFIQMDTVSNNGWESFGPTGAGADNNWSALDILPSGYTAVLLGIRNNFSYNSPGVTVSQIVYGRPTGGTTAGSQVLISHNQLTPTSSNTENNITFNETWVSVDSSGRLDLQRSTPGVAYNPDITVYLRGFIK